MSERKEKFTPGPWGSGYGTRDNGYLGVWRKFTNTVVCRVSPIDRKTKEDVANAALIAAAPDMYAALEELLDSESVSIFSSAMESESWKLDLKEWEVRARSALAKARGES